MPLNIQVKGKDKLFNYFSALQSKFGKDSMPRIIRSEAIIILNSLAKKEKKGKLSKLTEDGRRVGFNKADYSEAELSINSGLRGGVKNKGWVRLKDKNGKQYFTSAGMWDGKKSLSDNKWSHLISEGIAASKQQESIYKNSRGTTAKNWFELAKRIHQAGDNVVPDVVDFVARATRKDKKQLQTRSWVDRSNNSYVVNGTISSGILTKTGGQFRFNNALRSRSLFFKRALKKGWLDDANFVKRNLRGVTVNN